MVVVVAAVAKGELCRVLRVPVGRLGGRTGRASPVVPGGASLWGPHDWICIPSALQEPWLLFSQPFPGPHSCSTLCILDGARKKYVSLLASCTNGNLAAHSHALTFP